MSLLERFYPESRYGGFSDADGTVIFYSRVRALLRPEMTVLDVGCGRGAGLEDPVIFRRNLRTLRGECRKIIGIDVDPAATQNFGIDEFHTIENDNGWPIADASIDLIVADFVLEHVQDPQTFFSEVARVLKHGGFVCARTANRIGYVALLASLIPRCRHAKVLQTVQRKRSEADIFPAYYQVNTVWRLRRILAAAGFDGIAYGFDAEPAYLQFSAAAYGFGKYLHALTPSCLRNSIFVFARRQ